MAIVRPGSFTSLVLALMVGPAAASWPEPVAPGELLVEGQVVFADSGNPMAGATARLVAVVSPYESGLRQLQGLGLDEEVARDVTRDDGMFRLVPPKPGVWRVIVQAKGFASRVSRAVGVVQRTSLAPTPMEPSPQIRLAIVARQPGDTTRVRAPEERSVASPWDYYGFSASVAGASTLVLDDRRPGDITVFAVDGVTGRFGRFPAAGSTRIELGGACPRAGLRLLDENGAAKAGSLAFDSTSTIVLGKIGENGELRLCRGSEAVVVRDAGRRWARIDPEFAGSAHSTLESPPVIRWHAPARAAASVRDANSGAVIDGGIAWSTQSPEVWSTVARGAFELALPGDDANVAVAAPGYLAGRVSLRPGTVADLRLARSVDARGSVSGEDGLRVAGARVEARAASELEGPMAASGRAYADGAGRFAMPDLALGRRYIVTASAPGWPRQTVEYRSGSAESPGKPLDIVLRRARVLLGRVASSAGDALPDVVVEAMGERTEHDVLQLAAKNRDAAQAVANGRTDAKGNFRLRGPAPGETVLVLRAAGFVTRIQAGIVVEELPETIIGEIVLETAHLLTGLVVDPTGRPLQDVLIRPRFTVQGKGSVMMLSRIDAVEIRSDDHGHFSVGGIGRDDRIDLIAKKPGFALSSVQGIVLGSEPIVITLAPEAVVSGTVRDATGKGVAGARVAVAQERGKGDDVGMADNSLDATADAEGAFSIGGLQAGTVRVRASAPGFVESRLEPFSMAAGDRRSVELVLKRSSTIRGHVTSDDGAAVPGVRVSAGNLGARTADDGSYEVSGLATGRYSVRVMDTGLESLAQDIEISGAGEEVVVDLVVHARQSVSGHVMTGKGLAVAGVYVRLIAATGSRESLPSQTDALGAFTVRSVPPGSYRIEARQEGYRQSEPLQQVVVESSPITGLEVLLDEGVMLSGRIHGAHAGGATPTIVAGGSFETHAGKVGPDGRYRIGGLAPGIWTITAADGGAGRVATHSLTIAESDRELTLDLSLEEGCRVRGRATLDGAPSPGAKILLLTAEGRDVAWQAVQPNGAFAFEGVEVGSYLLQLESVDHRVLGERHISVACEDDDFDLSAQTVAVKP